MHFQKIRRKQGWIAGRQDQDIRVSVPDVNWKVNFNVDSTSRKFFVKRTLGENIYEITQGTEKYKTQDVPFVTNVLESAVELLKDTIGTKIYSNYLPLTRSEEHTSELQSLR